MLINRSGICMPSTGEKSPHGSMHDSDRMRHDSNQDGRTCIHVVPDHAICLRTFTSTSFSRTSCQPAYCRADSLSTQEAF